MSYVPGRIGSCLLVLACAAVLFMSQSPRAPWASNITLSTSTSTATSATAVCTPPAGTQLIGKYGGTMPFQEALLACASPSTARIRSTEQARLFEQGMLLLYGFNFDEARRNFQAAIALNATTCAYCPFGLAYSYGPNLNRNIEASELEAARTAIAEALLLAPLQSDDCQLERALLTAQLRLFDAQKWNTTGRHDYMHALAAAVDAAAAPPTSITDPAAAAALPLLRVFLAEAIINLQPWKYFQHHHGNKNKTMEPAVVPAFTTLKTLIQHAGFLHPLALHLYIHLTEQSDTPGDGLAAADALARLMRGSGTGHLVHMPAHIYMRTGRYDQCISQGLAAVAVDRLYQANCVAPYAAPHNEALLIVAAMAAGRMQLALKHAPSVLYTNADAATYLSALFPTPREMVLARFGRWKDIIAGQDKEDAAERAKAAAAANASAAATIAAAAANERDLSTPSSSTAPAAAAAERPVFLRALRLYPRSLAFIHAQPHLVHSPDAAQLLGRVTLAFSVVAAQIPPDEMPASHVFYPNHVELGGLMNATVHAAAAAKLGQFSSATEALRRGISKQDAMHYMEPENFYLPLRQCLAAVLISAADAATAVPRPELCQHSAGLLREATGLLARDLEEHPGNLWALRGMLMATQRLHECGGPGAPSAREVNALRLTLERSGYAKDVSSPCCEIAFC